MEQEFLQAIAKNDLENIANLIESNQELLNLRSKTGQSPILTAIYNGARKSVEFLLEKNIPLDVYEAAAAGVLPRVAGLVNANPELAKEYANDGFTALGLASYLGHKDIVEYLVGQGAELNSPSKNQMKVMPLHSAVATRKVEVAAILLQNGAQVNATQEAGWTPLHEAAMHGQEAMIKLLIEHGADVTLKKEDGETPLDVAMRRNHAHVVDLLRPEVTKA